MIRNFLKIALRNLAKHRLHSFLNIAGLSAGLAVTLLIVLWLNDELSFDKYHRHYERIAQVMQNQILNDEVYSGTNIPIPLGEELRTTYGNNFKRVVMSAFTGRHILAFGNNKFTRTGNYMEREAPSLFSLKMLGGSGNGLKDPYAILLSHSLATALFGPVDPLNKVIRFDDTASLKVTGVYEDLPLNTTLNDLQFIVPWELQGNHLAKNIHNWGNNGWQIYVQLADNVDMNKASASIKNAKYDKAGNGDQRFKPVIFLQPMSKWHLYSEFKNGVNIGGRIQYCWLIGIIGGIVLLLACINFMNLATAKSEKRAKEVGIRKAIGSQRKQLIVQFFSESLLMAAMSFILSLALVLLLLPLFNDIADKKLTLPITRPLFWALGFGFTMVAGLIAGSYPALYLSSFRPVAVLKGVYKAGRFAAVPRKVLVVLQFTASIALIIGTIVVFRQIQFAKSRPVGYARERLITVESSTADIYNHFDAFRNDLLKTGAVAAVAWSSTVPTQAWQSQGNFDWSGRDKSGTQDFGTIGISLDYGKTIGWQFVKGRDYRTGPEGADHLGFVVNESAVKLLGFKEPLGQIIHWYGYDFTIIGVVKDMVMNSPFTPAKPTIFYLAPWRQSILNIKLQPQSAMHDALKSIEQVYTHYNPGQPFEYKFVDEEYARKFALEERIGKLAGFFALLAIFISCLGIFGMASFIAEQRIKEVGIRKVLGASVLSLWRLLSADFVRLVAIAIAIAAPLAFYFMHRWLQGYDYRTTLPWWIFALAGAGALLITLLTVSFQAVQAALRNPVTTLRSE
ncbi:MAG TPA: ABC transporter permease [Puia sp.]|uniref:ABC transporter permease n=1 Tax=Puia sp. TaxID=2045100 RepID=UPI002B9F320D|nr:ABC transporter permease [Puia sp.]HVU93710.1 ABC transporter permease [Puia sp.]